jgi:ribose-phosphate pyrophosphokinase
MYKKDYRLFSGAANLPLAESIAKHLDMSLSKVDLKRFSDGESYCEIRENVRGVDAFIIQSTCRPVNDNVMELLILCDALRRASVGSITAVIPYYGYARQDRKVHPRSPITSKLVADLLIAAGVNRVVSIDLHAGQIQGFFNIPFDHLYAMPVMLDYLRPKFAEDWMVVSPDAGGVERARAYSKRLGGSFAIIDKRRERANVSEVMNVIGDVRGKNCVIVDDMIDTAGTLCGAAQALMDHGAKSVSAVACHGVLSGPAAERIMASPLTEVVVTDTHPLSEVVKACPKVKQVTVSKLLAEAIKAIVSGDSISRLFA